MPLRIQLPESMAKMQRSFSPWLSMCTQKSRKVRLLARHHVDDHCAAACAILPFWQVSLLLDPTIFALNIFFKYLYFNLFAARVFFFRTLIKVSAAMWTSVRSIGAALAWMALVSFYQIHW